MAWYLRFIINDNVKKEKHLSTELSSFISNIGIYKGIWIIIFFGFYFLLCFRRSQVLVVCLLYCIIVLIIITILFMDTSGGMLNLMSPIEWVPYSPHGKHQSFLVGPYTWPFASYCPINTFIISSSISNIPPIIFTYLKFIVTGLFSSLICMNYFLWDFKQSTTDALLNLFIF